jgi:hypothetical protein
MFPSGVQEDRLRLVGSARHWRREWEDRLRHAPSRCFPAGHETGPSRRGRCHGDWSRRPQLSSGVDPGATIALRRNGRVAEYSAELFFQLLKYFHWRLLSTRTMCLVTSASGTPN